MWILLLKNLWREKRTQELVSRLRSYLLVTFLLMVLAAITNLASWFLGPFGALVGIMAGLVLLISHKSSIKVVDNDRFFFIFSGIFMIGLMGIFFGLFFRDVRFASRVYPREISLAELPSQINSGWYAFSVRGITTDMSKIRTYDHSTRSHSYVHAVVPVVDAERKDISGNQVWAICENYQKGYDMEKCQGTFGKVHRGLILVKPEEKSCYLPTLGSFSGPEPLFVKLIGSHESYWADLWSDAIFYYSRFWIAYFVLTWLWLFSVIHRWIKTGG
ncbi:MAG: hypothetical protein RMJ98_16325 [Myxococcales bacterium]|nr:hypothetical protein [Polyangiaceae bacterium]MDW8250861.1 hypothetical protein [Myxococcales bacterium]